MNHPEEVYKFQDPISAWIAEGIHIKVPDETLVSFMEHNIAKAVKLDINGIFINACWKGTNAMILRLLDMGADIECLSISKSTPLMFLAENDNLQMFMHFINKGADLYASGGLLRDGRERNVEYYAREGGDVIKYIKELKTLALKNAQNLLRDREAIMQKNKELEDKINYLMTQMNTMNIIGTMNTASNDDESCGTKRKKQRIEEKMATN